jgi:phosphoserine phosphatase
MKTTPTIERFLESVPREKTPVAVFDCDGTLINGDIGEAMFYFQLEHFLFRESPADLWPDHPQPEELQRGYDLLHRGAARELRDGTGYASFVESCLLHYFGQLADGKTEKACSDIVRLFSGFKRSEIQEIAADTFRAELNSPVGWRRLGKQTLPQGIRYLREVRRVLERLRELEFDIRVVSGSNRWSVEELCRPLSIEPDQVIGIDLQVQGDVMSREIVRPVPVRQGKVEALETAGVSRPVVVVSDSIYDLPLFKYCEGLKILVRANNSGEKFFEHTGIRPDDSWVIIDRPTMDAA